MSFPLRLLPAVSFVAGAFLINAWDRPTAAQNVTPAADTQRIAARVGDSVIDEVDVQRDLARLTRNTPVRTEDLPAIRKAVLEQLIKQELVLIRFRREQRLVGEREINDELSRRKKTLTDRGTSWEKHLEEMKADEESLRRQLLWQLSWATYLDHMLTDENLRRYFEKYRTKFDGTQLRVAHILFAVAENAPQEAWTSAIAKAADVRAEIDGKELTFADAARKYSQAPTAEKGGEIGLIGRQEPMPEPFSQAAFELKPKEISQPVVTTHGVHLIQCLEVMPGTKTWQEVRDDLEHEVTRYLFEWNSDSERQKVKVSLP